MPLGGFPPVVISPGWGGGGGLDLNPGCLTLKQLECRYPLKHGGNGIPPELQLNPISP